MTSLSCCLAIAKLQLSNSQRNDLQLNMSSIEKKKTFLLGHSVEWRSTVSVKLYIVGTQLDDGVTGRDHKSDQP